MTESIYKEYQNKYYNPNDNDKRPGDNDNWKSIQKGFHDIGATQLETSAGLTLGKGTEDETSVTASELAAMFKINPDWVIVTGISAFTINANSDYVYTTHNTQLATRVREILERNGGGFVFMYGGCIGGPYQDIRYLHVTHIAIGDQNGAGYVDIVPNNFTANEGNITIGFHNSLGSSLSIAPTVYIALIPCPSLNA